MESSKANQPAGGVTTQPRRKLSAKEILVDIRAGMTDRAFEQKYHLTPEGREKVFKKLIAAGHLTAAELEWRSKLLRSQKASGNVPASQAAPIATPIAPRDTDEKPPTPTESPTALDSKMGSIISKFRDGSWVEDKKTLILLLIFASPLGLYGLWKTSRFQAVAKVILAVVTTALVIALPLIAILLWVGCGTAALCYALWGRFKGANQRITQVASPLRRGEQTAVPNQSKAVAIQATRSNEPVSVEEIEEAIKRMQTARRDMFGIAGDIGIVGVGAAGGGIAAGTIAAFFGATSIWGLTTAGASVGLSIVGQTPWLFITGCAIVGAVLAFSVSRLIRLGTQGDERRKRNINELKRDVEKQRKAAEKSDVDKDKFNRLAESITMLLSNGKITPEESDGLINGIRNGTITYEFAFDFIEDNLKE